MSLEERYSELGRAFGYDLFGFAISDGKSYQLEEYIPLLEEKGYFVQGKEMPYVDGPVYSKTTVPTDLGDTATIRTVQPKSESLISECVAKFDYADKTMTYSVASSYSVMTAKVSCGNNIGHHMVSQVEKLMVEALKSPSKHAVAKNGLELSIGSDGSVWIRF